MAKTTRMPRPKAQTGVVPAGLTPRTAAMLAEVRTLLAKPDYDGAERVLTGAQVLAASHPEVQRLQGLLHHRRRRFVEAEQTYTRLLAVLPNDSTLLGQISELRADMGDVQGAIELARRVVAQRPDDADAWFRLGALLDRQGSNEDALSAGERALKLAPTHTLARLLMARSLQALGRIDETAAQYRKLIAQGGPRAYQAWFSLVDLKTVRLSDKELATLQRLASDPSLGDEVRATLGFALGKACEDAGRLADAYASFTRANAIKRRGLKWSAAAFSGEVDAIRAAFSGDLASAPDDLGREVIFVLGMPRSGTTLVEQILAAHSAVEGASELPDLPAVIAQESQRRGLPFPQWVASAGEEDWKRLGRDYLARTARWRNRRPHSTDKLPINWPMVGAIRAMLPGAKIIDCRRDPLETCWSCYKQLFAPNLAGFSYDFADLAAYWRDYDRLSRFWAQRYPDRVRVQDYEALQHDFEREVRALLAFCSLPFEEACLRFHESDRSIRTASSAQVRQPLRTDTARAPRYGALLDPLRAALAS